MSHHNITPTHNIVVTVGLTPTRSLEALLRGYGMQKFFSVCVWRNFLWDVFCDSAVAKILTTYAIHSTKPTADHQEDLVFFGYAFTNTDPLVQFWGYTGAGQTRYRVYENARTALVAEPDKRFSLETYMDQRRLQMFVKEPVTIDQYYGVGSDTVDCMRTILSAKEIKGVSRYERYSPAPRPLRDFVSYGENGVEGDLYIARNAASSTRKAVIVYLTGGGFVHQGRKHVISIMSNICDDCDSIAWVPDYLGPEGSEQFLESWRKMDTIIQIAIKLKAKYSCPRLVFIGESSGGNLLLRSVFNRQLTRTSSDFLVLIAPQINNVAKPDDSLRLEVADPWNLRPRLIDYQSTYQEQIQQLPSNEIGHADLNHIGPPELNAIDHLPKMLIVAMQKDVLRREQQEFYQKLSREGYDIRLTEIEHGIHGSFQMCGRTEAGKVAQKTVTDEIRSFIAK